MPLITVITPSYNQAQFLEKTIQSVLAQDFPEIEYLVVDGGSTDGSQDIIRRYAERLAWWVSEPDAGQADAINKGFRRASGEYVAWLNSDDLYLPGAIRTAVDALQGDPALGMVFGDALTIGPAGEQLNRLEFGDWGLAELVRFRIICQPAVIMRRSVLEAVGHLDPGYHFMLDHQLWLRIAARAPIRHLPALMAAARHHPGAKNVAQAAGFGQEARRIFDWMSGRQPFETIIRQDRRLALAGLHRLDARYLLDGGLPGPALRAYAQAFAASPSYALKHWHRMLYAALCLVGGKRLGSVYYRLRRKKSIPLPQQPGGLS
jgi:glycosyltransferase involved in cell wall biosynthesis